MITTVTLTSYHHTYSFFSFHENFRDILSATFKYTIQYFLFTIVTLLYIAFSGHIYFTIASQRHLLRKILKESKFCFPKLWCKNLSDARSNILKKCIYPNWSTIYLWTTQVWTCRSTYMQIFSVNIQPAISIPVFCISRFPIHGIHRLYELFCTILYKRLVYPWILASARVLEPIFHQYQGIVVKLLGSQKLYGFSSVWELGTPNPLRCSRVNFSCNFTFIKLFLNC